MNLSDLSPFTKRLLVGVKVEDQDPEPPTWDGSMLHIRRIKWEPWILHERAHYLIATPRLRKLPNYGLGKDPDNGPWTTCVVWNERASAAESDASLLTIVMAYRGKFDWKDVQRELNVTWDDKTSRSIRRIRRKGIVLPDTLLRAIFPGEPLPRGTT